MKSLKNRAACFFAFYLVVFNIFPFNVYAADENYFFKSGVAYIDLSYTSMGTAYITANNLIHCIVSDDSSRLTVFSCVCSSEFIDFTDIGSVTFKTSMAQMDSGVSALIRLTTSHTYNALSPAYVLKYLNGADSITLDTSNVEGDYYLEFGLISTAYTSKISGEEWGLNSPSTDSYSGSGEIYISSVSYNGNSSSGSDSGNSGSVNVDLTPTNNLLGSINDKLYSIIDSLGTIKDKITNISDSFNDCLSLLIDIKEALYIYLDPDNLSIIDLLYLGLQAIYDELYTFHFEVLGAFDNLNIFLDEKFEGVYNVVMYGNPEGDDSDIVEYQNKLEGFNQDFDSFNSSISSASGYIDSAGENCAAYIQNFASFYSYAEQLAGIGAILTLGLALIFVSKVIGR